MNKNILIILTFVFIKVEANQINLYTSNCLFHQKKFKEITLNIGTDLKYRRNTINQTYSIRYMQNLKSIKKLSFGTTFSYSIISGEYTNTDRLIFNAFSQVNLFKDFYLEGGIGGTSTISSARAKSNFMKPISHLAFGKKLNLYKNYFIDIQYQRAVVHGLESINGQNNQVTNNLFLGLGIKF